MFISGLGFMTGAVVLIFIVGQKVGLQGQLLLSAGLGESQLELITRLAKRIIIMAITVQIIGAEWSNPDTIGQESVNGKITESLFHTVNRASGFSTIDYAEIHDSNIAVTSVLMLVGGASGTTTAGIKVSTLMVIVFAGIAAVRGKRQTRSFGREIASAIVVRAFAVAISAVIGIFSLLFLLLLVQPELDERAAMFEIISAFATTGWSAGATPQLNSAARVVVTVAMFVGRFGPFTIALFMSERARVQSFRFPVEQVRIG